MRLQLLPLLFLLIAGCKERPASFHPAYLNQKMNEDKTIPLYQYQALRYEASIRGTTSAIAYKRVGHCLIYAQSAQVSFQQDHVFLDITLYAEATSAHKWVATSSEQDRVAIGDDICAAHIRRLATELECDLAAINAGWVCMNGNVSGKVSGDSLKTTKTSEQDGTGQPATRPESKSEGSDKPQPEAEGRSR
jgi:hypothetical protein